jgi:putative endonuclease
MKYVYVLQSLTDPERYYSGSTFDLKRRYDEHNSGKSTHTNKHKPWKLVTYFAFEDHATADRFEQYLKTASGRAFATKRLGYTQKTADPYRL